MFISSSLWNSSAIISEKGSSQTFHLKSVIFWMLNYHSKTQHGHYYAICLVRGHQNYTSWAHQDCIRYEINVPFMIIYLHAVSFHNLSLLAKEARKKVCVNFQFSLLAANIWEVILIRFSWKLLQKLTSKPMLNCSFIVSPNPFPFQRSSIKATFPNLPDDQTWIISSS